MTCAVGMGLSAQSTILFLSPLCLFIHNMEAPLSLEPHHLVGPVHTPSKGLANDTDS